MLTAENPLRDIARLVVWFPLRWLVMLLPIRWAFGLFEWLGLVHCALGSGKRRMIRQRLAAAATGGDVRIDAEVRQYFKTHYVSQLLIFLVPRLNGKSIRPVHEFEGLAHLEKALARGKGCILVHPHFGPVHLPLLHLGLLQYPVCQLGYLRKPSGLSAIGDRVAFRLRARYEGMMPVRILQGNRFLRPLFQHLADNGLLLMTGDGTGGGEFIGRFASFHFLAGQRLFPLGPGALAVKTGASLLPMFTVPGNGSARYRTVIGPPLFPSESGIESSPDPAELVSQFVVRFEEHLKRNPGSWHFWDETEIGAA